MGLAGTCRGLAVGLVGARAWMFSTITQPPLGTLTQTADHTHSWRRYLRNAARLVAPGCACRVWAPQPPRQALVACCGCGLLIVGCVATAGRQVPTAHGTTRQGLSCRCIIIALAKFRPHRSSSSGASRCLSQQQSVLWRRSSMCAFLVSS